MTDMNYIDQIAEQIYWKSNPSAIYIEDRPLYRLYAVLMLAKGSAVTNEDIHNAWSAWVCEYQPGHRSLVPYSDLPEHVQQMDTPYTEAIQAVACGMGFTVGVKTAAGGLE